MSFAEIVTAIDGWAWGPWMLILLVGTGLYLTIRTKFLCWRNLGYSIKSTLSKDARKTDRGTGDVSPFACLCTALAATIGTGNIAGVASALAAGGPGALVWMWISAAFGITSKFTECALAVKYRITNSDGEMLGGPMITAEYGIPKAYGDKWKPLGKILGIVFAVFAVIASFGIGNLSQGSSISSAVSTVISADSNIVSWIVAVVIGVLVLAIVLGGLKRISKVSSVVVPVMAIFYVVGGLVIIIVNITALPAAVVNMFTLAFSGKSVAGGVIGSLTYAIITAMQKGVARGCFSNEAGMGSAAITAAAATTDNHVRQGYINSTGTFWDTFLVCSITGLAILTSGVFDSPGALTGPALTIAAFESVMGPAGGWLVAVALFLFAFSTILGWEYHGEKALEYLSKAKAVKMAYRLIFSVLAFVGCVTSFGVAIDISDILNALMVVPNAIIMIILVGPLVKDMEDFEIIKKKEKAAKKN